MSEKKKVEYGELSRRALIKMNGDFDVGNKNSLSNFLNDAEKAKPGTYEKMRNCEKVIEVGDAVGSGVKMVLESDVPKNIKNIAGKVMDSVVEKAKKEIYI